MRSRRIAVLCSAVAFLVVTSTAGATEPGSEELRRLQQMEERLLQMEDRLEATTAQLDAAEDQVQAQSEVLANAGLASGRGSSNGLTDFVNEIDFGGWVAGSYVYNFNGPDGSFLGGANSGSVAAYPFHPDSNSFSLDQFWIEIERSADEEHRAGFRVDLVYGKSAGLLSGVTGGDGISGNDFDLYQAYVEYLAPIGNGVNFKFGKFGTLIGAEVMASPYNFNISRGHVYNLFEPFTHTGILASTEIAGVSVSLGGINETRSFDAADIDLGNGKALLWGLGYEMGDFGLSFAGAWGAADSGGSATGNSGDDELILDFILSWDPTENFSTYINADYIVTDNAAVDPFDGSLDDIDGFGIAWAARYGLTDRTGVSLRFEYAQLDNVFASATSLEDLNVWGITGTVDHLLTDELMLRGEIRYDQGDDDMGDNIFLDDGPGLEEDDQVVLLLEAIYKFDGFGE